MVAINGDLINVSALGLMGALLQRAPAPTPES